METGIFAAGCFWKPDLEFEELKGVKKTEVGYCGGNSADTTYENVCSGTTNHAEVVKVFFDEGIISFEELVKFFLKIHNPTTLNRQGPDIGTQYRSEIFYNNEIQKKIAEKVLNDESKNFNGRIVTKVSKELNYCKAEDYHQKYLKKRGM
ncbi:MAG: peptide-methionine (S)-S-oxide reductase [Euryarchaeota archaeon]|nr:peptide-methionine (S)-S-oxide reductase [Euryarchaeota archaeon]|tara:strand:+ start:475 stop:924 length:450 start_codon:yes stop_codon:yes gene_type:complete